MLDGLKYFSKEIGLSVHRSWEGDGFWSYRREERLSNTFLGV